MNGSNTSALAESIRNRNWLLCIAFDEQICKVRIVAGKQRRVLHLSSLERSINERVITPIAGKSGHHLCKRFDNLMPCLKRMRLRQID